MGKIYSSYILSMPDSNAKPQHTPSVRTWNATIAEASHDVLIEHRNLDHIALFQAYRKLQNDNANAAAAYSILQARFETLQSVFSSCILFLPAD
jgi:hypothetical protein